jgi:hypothetical protein
MVMTKRFAVVLTTVIVMLATAGAASAVLPKTQSRPFQAVCEAQGGRFEISTDLLNLYCVKGGGLFTAFTEAQLAVQRTICERVYRGFFGLQGEGTNSTRTFC